MTEPVIGHAADVLLRVVAAAHSGFEQANATLGGPVQWPADFPDDAKNAAESILRRAARVDSLVVDATGKGPLVVRDLSIGGAIVSRPKARRAYGSVDGTLKMLLGRESVVKAGLREFLTNNYVICTFNATEWGTKLGAYWNVRVVVEGQVAYDEHGRPVSVNDVRDIQPKLPVRLRDLRGIAPEMTDGLRSDQFTARMRKG